MTGRQSHKATLVARLTPAGRGAVATVAVTGPVAIEAVSACFRPAASPELDQTPMGRIRFGRWCAPPSAGEADRSVGEELVVCQVAADQVEVHCHGGAAAVSAVIQALVRQGCQHVSWAEYRAAIGVPRWQVLAEQALATASTERTAILLLAQQQGALARELEQLQKLLDQRQLAGALAGCRRLLGLAPFGLHLTRPWQVVLAGLPNVGKSSLINALVGYQRTVVFDQPGTTRDVVHVDTAMDGWPIQLSDTAGLRQTLDPLESLGIARTQTHLASADLVLLVVDAATLHDAAKCAAALGQSWQAARRAPLVVANKSDLLDRSPGQQLPETDDQILFTSAITGQGIEQLTVRIAQRLVPHPPPPEAGVPFAPEQVVALEQLEQALQGRRTEEAGELLRNLLR